MDILKDIALSEQVKRRHTLTGALIVQMANTLNTVLKIRRAEDPFSINDAGESVVSRVEALMRRLERDIKDCGHLIRDFHKHNQSS